MGLPTCFTRQGLGMFWGAQCEVFSSLKAGPGTSTLKAVFIRGLEGPKRSVSHCALSVSWRRNSHHLSCTYPSAVFGASPPR